MSAATVGIISGTASFHAAEAGMTDPTAFDPNVAPAGTSAAIQSPISFSILIGRVSSEDSARILETLDALQDQKGAPSYEVIVADRRLDGVTELIGVNYPETQVIHCAASTSLPELRAVALDKSRGNYIVVIEDHCVPPNDWLANIFLAFRVAPKGTAAVAGAVENGTCDTAIDWATFFCEYSAFVGPVRNGRTESLPGMNVAYLRSPLVQLDRRILLDGFWETTVHPLLSRNGSVLYLSNLVWIAHKKRFSFTLFARQRFLYSRYYAGMRFRRNQFAARWAMCVLTAALPPLILFRIGRNLAVKKRLFPQFIRALPYLTVFALIWAWGEMVGYARGAGDALPRIE
jgi:glycosyltransferase involved in cell wall biosynthesis